MTGTTLVLDAVTFYGYEPEDGRDDKFIFREFEGFNSPAPRRGQTIARPNGDGDFDLQVYRGSRLILASGSCRSATEGGLLALQAQFDGILAGGAAGVLTVNEFGVVRTATGRPWGEWRFERVGGLWAEWSWKLSARNPAITTV